MRVVPEELGVSADEFCDSLKSAGIPCAAHYIGKPIHAYPLFQNHSAFARGNHAFSRRDYSKEQTPVAQQILDSCVILFVNEGYTNDDLEFTAQTIKTAAESAP
jgi:dTDP-4-amino-4,6-dideoxygalactose transaminase